MWTSTMSTQPSAMVARPSYRAAMARVSRVTKAIEDALQSPLLRNRDVFGSQKLLFHIFFSRKANNQFKMSEVDELNNFVSSLSSEVDVIWGLGFDETLGDKVKITILAAGFDPTVGDDSRVNPHRVVNTEPQVKPEPKKPEAKEQEQPVPDEIKQRLHDDYGTDIFEGMGARYIVMQPSQLDDDNVIESMERTPTFNRDKRTMDEIANTTSQHPDKRDINPDDASRKSHIEF